MGEWIVRLWISKAPKCFLELEKCLTMKIYISAIITMFGNKELAWVGGNGVESDWRTVK